MTAPCSALTMTQLAALDPTDLTWTDVTDDASLVEGGCAVLEVRPAPSEQGGRRELKVAVYRWQGRLYAIDSWCAHYGGPLENRRVLMGGVVECPWHDWRFELATGACENFPGRSTATYPVRVIDGRVQVGVPVADVQGTAT